MVQVAVSQMGHRGNIAWWECHTCKQRFTGAMRTGLAEAWWARVRDAVEENAERLAAAYNLGQSLYGEGQYGEAERVFREVHGIRMRLLGAEHPLTLSCAHEIALCLSVQGKYAKAEQIYREVLAVRKRVLGPEHPNTLMSASNLAVTLFDQRKYTEAQLLCAATLEAQRRVLGPAHPDTLRAASMLDQMRSHTGCASEEASSVCARCEAVRYCSHECQRADWRAHKPACAVAAAGAS
jgi:tetratricopeptide (TPR) repeat protein